VHVGVQVGAEVPDPVPGDTEPAVFDLVVEVVESGDGLDFRGRAVHGPRGTRFVYPGQVAPVRDRRPDRTRGHASWHPIEASLDLTDAHGAPVCASVRPPVVSWRLVPG
jgi:Family of unknown function (DUF5990)